MTDKLEIGQELWEIKDVREIDICSGCGESRTTITGQAVRGYGKVYRKQTTITESAVNKSEQITYFLKWCGSTRKLDHGRLEQYLNKALFLTREDAEKALKEQST